MSNELRVKNCPKIKAAEAVYALEVVNSGWPKKDTRDRLRQLKAASELCSGPIEISRTVVDRPFAGIRRMLGRDSTREVVEYECCRPTVTGSNVELERAGNALVEGGMAGAIAYVNEGVDLQAQRAADSLLPEA